MTSTLIAVLSGVLTLSASARTIEGQYLEVRTCDVYTGPCFANAETGLTGKEAILVWSVDKGTWNDVDLSGLRVVAVIRTDNTLGDQRYDTRRGTASLIVDERASGAQRDALAAMARSLGGTLLEEVVAVRAEPIEAEFASCSKSSCAYVRAGSLVNIETRCLGEHDHLCGNEEVYYPPLTGVTDARPAFTELATFRGGELDLTWTAVGQRSAFLASFSR